MNYRVFHSVFPFSVAALLVVLALWLPGADDSDASTRGQLLVDTAWVASHQKDPGVKIVDVMR